MIKNLDIPFIKDEQKFWNNVEESCLDDKVRKVYLNRKKAVNMYLDGFTYMDIKQETGISGHSEAKRLLMKCLQPDEFGNYSGFSVLLPNKRGCSKYRRHKDDNIFYDNKGKSGMFNKLLNDYPELKQYIEDLFFGKNKSVLEKNMSKNVIHQKFKDKCRDIDIKEYEYPFNVKSIAKKSLYTYLNQLEIEYPLKSKNRLSDNALQRLSSTGIGQPNSIRDIRPFSVVELDGHLLDCIATIELCSPAGDIEIKTLKRFFLLTLIDEATRTILGYHLTPETQYDRFDVLKCIKNAIVPKELFNFNIKGLEYPENKGFHSLAILQTEWAVFDEIKLDNAKSHLSKDVIKQVSEYLNATVNFGPVATPENRPLVERFYKTIESRGFHRIPSTTGSGILDPKRRNAEKDAIKHIVTFDEISELAEILIAQYNNTPHSGINGFTPLEVMKQRIERGLLPNYLEKEKRENFMLNYITVTRKVRGKIGSGRRPYVSFEGAEYRSEVLSVSFGLVGRTLTLRFNSDDIRICKAFFEDGSYFCDLVVVGNWRNNAHSLDQRKAANALLNEKKLKENKNVDPIEHLENYYKEKSRKYKYVRNKLLSLQRTLNNNEKSYDDNKGNLYKDTPVNINKNLLTDIELQNRFMKKSNQIKFNV